MKKHTIMIAAAISVLAACASTTKPGVVGVQRQQLLLVSAEKVEQMALVNYTQQNREAQSKGRLVTKGADYERLKKIAARLQAHVGTFRDDAAKWNWQLALIDAPVINATCAPGGKITFYTGLIRQLKLNDDEIAIVMGHEIAHALREHGRERVSRAYAQNALTTTALAAAPNSQAQIEAANAVAHYLYMLPNSRQNESEADAMGLELAARAGYKPEASVAVWRKMQALDKKSGEKRSAEFTSTHPSNETRIGDLTAMLPKVTPLYQAALPARTNVK
ncbi:M48 family metallopeptidase [Massilia sp. METH4]|uniref:M48 family metallopeptidase n=1 Tax=Massilia sp. METH4 TaxID=3123041 RepID=UPI0030CD256E